MNVSVIITVYNERNSIQRLLDSLATQTRLPDEIIICDGGSTDGTVEFIQAYCLSNEGCLPDVHLLVEPGANISRGRNLAIDAAKGPIIAATDSGVRISPEWLAHLTTPWESDEDILAVAGFFYPDVSGVFQTAMAATVLPLVDEIDPDKFLPSSRSVAFLKEVWKAAGGYPEWLDYCEDLLFDFAINVQKATEPTGFAFAPNALVYFRPRENLRQFWTQYYRYARGDGKADLWRKRHAARYATYMIGVPALIGHIGWGLFAPWLGWAGLAGGVFVYCRRPWQRLGVLGKDLSPAEQTQAALLVPVIRFIGDAAKMVGYPVGLYWRWRNRERPEIQSHKMDHNRGV